MLAILAVFLLPILTGGLLVHLLWPDRELKNLILQAFLGTGIGLGITSLSYFLYMAFFAGQHWFMALQVVALVAALAASLWQARKQSSGSSVPAQFIRPSRVQLLFFAFGLLVFLISLASTASYILRRKQGDWDAWMMYNRAARFIYRDQSHWLESFSSQMDPIFHADYPLFLAMNIASGWDTLGNDSPRVPMAQSAIFAVACAGLLASALACAKSPGQAALGLIVFWGTPTVVTEGARELADVPLAYFFLATGVLIYLYFVHRKAGLLVLAGFTAGLAAWMKNEGSVFVLAAAIGLAIAFLREKPWRVLLWYAMGLIIPLAIVLYFKFFLAPPSDVLSNGPARSIAQALDLARHAQILGAFWNELLTFGGWAVMAQPIGILVVLLVYWLLTRAPFSSKYRPMFAAALVVLVIQMLGYYAVYVITPYDLQWHLGFSIFRIFLQVFPLIAFVTFSSTRSPESIFGDD